MEVAEKSIRILSLSALLLRLHAETTLEILGVVFSGQTIADRILATH
jgi:hypothetical protein